jgi:hypothetical protein
MDADSNHAGPRLTRRRLFGTGGAATAAVLLAGPGAGMANATAVLPSHLRRSSYAGLSGETFRVAGGTLTLHSVADLPGTPAGSDDAFSLIFTGSGPAQGIHSFSHPDLGAFELFLAPVDDPGATPRYEAIVNRTVGVPRTPPHPNGGPAGGSRLALPPEESFLIRRASARRVPGGVACEVVFAEDAEVKRVAAWLVRGDKVLGAASRRGNRKRRMKLRLRHLRRLRGGRHVVVVIVTAADGRTSARRVRLARR